MTKSPEILFKPFSYNGLELRNRIVMAPMTRQFSPGNVPNQMVADYYRRRAEGGVGLIVTEGTFINHKAANGYKNVPRIYGDDALDGWKRVVDGVHEAGGKIIPQIWHVGAIREKGMEPDFDVPGHGPSAIATGKRETPVEMSLADIHETVEAFGEAAANAKKVGFDGVEIHGAHGYLIDQFFWERSNQRTDDYGGSFENRNRFAKEIVEAVRSAVGPDFPIVFRYSQWKMDDYETKLAETPEKLKELLDTLVTAGVDIFHASTRRFWIPEFEDSELNLAGWTKKLSGKPTITVGCIGLDDPSWVIAQSTGIDKLIDRFENDEFDLAAVGRQLIADPDWLKKVRDGSFDAINTYSKQNLKALN